jgi:hypothetical protein
MMKNKKGDLQKKKKKMRLNNENWFFLIKKLFFTLSTNEFLSEFALLKSILGFNERLRKHTWILSCV